MAGRCFDAVARRLSWLARLACIAAAGLAFINDASAQILSGIGTENRIEAGKLLVAAPYLQDADFEETVVLIVRCGEQGVLGLMVNQPTSVRAGSLFPNLKTGSARAAQVYKGGPVRMGLNALLRSRTKPSYGAAISGDLFLISEKPAMIRAAEATQSQLFRVYVGLCGWSSASQLTGEIRRGLWLVINPDSRIVFDDHPESVWSRSIAKIGGTK